MPFVSNAQSRYQVKTSRGWQSFDGVKKTKREIVELRTKRSVLFCSPEHKIKCVDGTFKCVRDLSSDELLIDDVVVSVRYTHAKEDVYDLINVSNGHEYLTNGIVSSNCAFIRDFEDIWTGLYPTISTGGSTIILSTPNGVGGQYYKLWTEGVSGVNEFNTINLPWHVHPEHDQAWFDHETKNLPKRKIAQEFLCVGGTTKFITPGGYQLAEQLRVGDLVLTHKGRFRPVTRVCSRLVESGEKLYEISSPGNRCDKFVLTGNHPMLSYRFWSNRACSYDQLRQNPVEASWIKAEDIASRRKNTDKILSVLIPQFKPDMIDQTMTSIDLSMLYESIDVSDLTCRYVKQWGNTKRYVNVDFDLGKFIGLYLAKGCSHRGGVDLGFHSNEIETHARWCVDYLEALNCSVTLLKSTFHNGCRLWTYNKHIRALVDFFMKSTPASNGRHSPNKVLNMDRVLACGLDFIRGLLYGHHAGDGNHSHDKKTCTYSTSSNLIYQLRTLNTMFGLYPRIGCNKLNKNNSKRSDMWYLEFQAEGVTYAELLEQGQQYRPGSRTMLYNNSFVGKHRLTDVSSLADIDGGYKVYDISVAEDQSFVVHSATLHNCDFISSGDTFLQPTELDYLRGMVDGPTRKEGPQSGVWIWSDPEPGKKYVISADVSRGDGADFSTFHVIDVNECEVVAEYMGKIPPDKLADLLLEYGKMYNTALLCPERNTFGYFTCVKLRDAGYKRLYYRNVSGDMFEYISNDPDAVPGFETQGNTRPQILAKLEEIIRNKVIKIYSQRTYDQMQAFIWNGSKAQASRDSHDDLIMSLAIGVWLTNGGTAVSEAGREMAMAMLKATRVERRDQNQLPGGVNEAQPLVNPNIRGFNPYNVHKPRDASQVRHADVSDFSWLLR